MGSLLYAFPARESILVRLNKVVLAIGRPGVEDFYNDISARLDRKVFYVNDFVETWADCVEHHKLAGNINGINSVNFLRAILTGNVNYLNVAISIFNNKYNDYLSSLTASPKVIFSEPTAEKLVVEDIPVIHEPETVIETFPEKVLISDPDILSSMTVSELKEYALSHDIDLAGAKLKADIVNEILNASEDFPF